MYIVCESESRIMRSQNKNRQPMGELPVAMVALPLVFGRLDSPCAAAASSRRFWPVSWLQKCFAGPARLPPRLPFAQKGPLFPGAPPVFVQA